MQISSFSNPARLRLRTISGKAACCEYIPYAADPVGGIGGSPDKFDSRALKSQSSGDRETIQRHGFGSTRVNRVGKPRAICRESYLIGFLRSGKKLDFDDANGIAVEGAVDADIFVLVLAEITLFVELIGGAVGSS